MKRKYDWGEVELAMTWAKEKFPRLIFPGLNELMENYRKRSTRNFDPKSPEGIKWIESLFRETYKEVP